MNIKRVFFWLCFVVVLGLIVWGLVAAGSKPKIGLNLGAPAPVTATDYISGPENAKVTMIEYGDFQCPACGAYATLVERLMTEASSTLRVVFRHYPLPQHPNARVGAYAAEAAAVQGKFWDMYRLLYSGQAEWSDLSDTDAKKVFAGYASDLGLNVAKFNQDSASAATVAKVDAELAEGQAVGIAGTPTFFVNGKAIENPQSYEQFKAVIDQAAK